MHPISFICNFKQVLIFFDIDDRQNHSFSVKYTSKIKFRSKNHHYDAVYSWFKLSYLNYYNVLIKLIDFQLSM